MGKIVTKKPVTIAGGGHVLAALELIVSGEPSSRVDTLLRQQFPGADVDSLLLAAADEIEAAGTMHPDDARGWCVLAAREIYRQAVAEKSKDGRKQALDCIRLIYDITTE